MATGIFTSGLQVVGQPINLAETAACYLVTAKGLDVDDTGADTVSWHLINSLEEGLRIFGSGNSKPSKVNIKYTMTAATLGETIDILQTVTDADGVTWTNDATWTASGGETEIILPATCLKAGPDYNVNSGTITTLGTLIGTATLTACTNPADAYNGSFPSSPDLDYTAEHVLWLHFNNYEVGPVIMKNVYCKAVQTGGVSTVTSADFTPAMSTINDIITETSYVPAWFAIPGFATDAASTTTGDPDDLALFDLMLNARNLITLFIMNLVLDYDPSETDYLNVVSALGIGSNYRKENVQIGWPKLNGYHASVHRIAITMANMVAKEKGDGMPYWSAANTDTNMKYNTLDTIQLNYLKVAELEKVGCFSWLKDFSTPAIKCFGSTTAYYLESRAVQPDEAPVFNSDSATNQSNWMQNQSVLYIWDNLSSPFNRGNIDAIVIKINNLGELQTDAGAQLGFRVVILKADNSDTDLAAKKIKPRYFFYPAGALKEVELLPTLDYSYLSTLY